MGMLTSRIGTPLLGVRLSGLVRVASVAQDFRRFDIMKKTACFTLFMAVLLSLLLASIVAAEGVRATKYGKDKNEENAVKTDYHVTLVSDTKMSNARGSLWRGGRHNGECEYNEDSTEVSITWTGITVPKNGTVQWRVWLTQEEKNKIHPKNPHFTPKTPTLADTTYAPVLGFEVEACGDFSLTNSNGDDISYSDLEYTVLPDTIPLTPDEIQARLEASEGENPFAEFGAWTSLPDGTVPALGETYLTTLDILEEEYLYCFHSEDFADQPGYACLSFIEHEHQSLGPSAVEGSTWSKIKAIFRDLFN
jgi:hypothetical protein